MFKEIEFKDIRDHTKWEWFQLSESFNIPIGQNYNSVIEAKSGDIMGFCRLEYKDRNRIIADNFILYNGDMNITSISKELTKLNPWLFINITKNVLRDLKLKEILTNA